MAPHKLPSIKEGTNLAEEKAWLYSINDFLKTSGQKKVSLKRVGRHLAKILLKDEDDAAGESNSTRKSKGSSMLDDIRREYGGLRSFCVQHDDSAQKLFDLVHEVNRKSTSTKRDMYRGQYYLKYTTGCYNKESVSVTTSMYTMETAEQTKVDPEDFNIRRVEANHIIKNDDSFQNDPVQDHNHPSCAFQFVDADEAKGINVSILSGEDADIELETSSSTSRGHEHKQHKNKGKDIDLCVTMNLRILIGECIEQHGGKISGSYIGHELERKKAMLGADNAFVELKQFYGARRGLSKFLELDKDLFRVTKHESGIGFYVSFENFHLA